MPLMPNNTKRKMRAGEVALGFGVHHLRSVCRAGDCRGHRP